MSMGNSEILQIADAVAREKGINKESVIEAMEQAIQVAGRRKYGHKHNIKAEIDRKTGGIKLFRAYEVVEEVENITTEILLEDAKQKDPEIELGGFVYEDLPPIDLGRVAAQAAKQVIVQKVRDAERERQYEDFKGRIGEIMNGTVKRIEFGDVIVDLGREEAILKRHATIPNESFRQNDRIRVYVEDVRQVTRGPQIFLSRTSNDFLAKLFAQEVPEVYDNVIDIKGVAREPGSRAKMAVYCGDSSIDPVGSCVGVRGARVQAVIGELQGEKIDIIQWSADNATFVINALAPAEVTKIVIDEDKGRIEVVVPSEQLSLAIGRRGQNVRLASKLTGWNIDVLTEDEESKRRVDEFKSVTDLFIQELDIEEVMAQLLAAEGFSSVDEIAYVNITELANIEGFDQDLAEALQARAQESIEKKNKVVEKQIKELGVDKKLQKILGLEPNKLLKLAENGIKCLEDMSDLTYQEFNSILPGSGKSKEEIEGFVALALEAEEKEKEGNS